ncbi:MAG TPA: endopeptidase La [Pelagibacteraceae bacterium]|jgi:ATP-dependent Lon protease|nr:endopeptidase La [Pelagibacteraceae bacterium]
MSNTDFFPLLPLRDIVVFPGMIVPLFVGRDKSIKALNEVMKTNKKIILVAQKNAETDEPSAEDLYSVGCESKVLQLLKLPDGTVKVLIEGIDRVKILECKNDREYLTSLIEIVKDKIDSKEDLLAFSIVILRKLEKLTNLNKKISFELMTNLKELKDPSKIADHIASQLNMSIFEKQKLLEIFNLKQRLEKLIEHINNEINVLGVEKRIRGRVKNQMEKTQREYYLNEQMKAIQKELGEIEDGKDEITHLQKAILKAKMTKEATKKCLSELKKLKSMSSMSAEATVVRNYLDWMIELPWQSKDHKLENITIPEAKRILDEDHYALEKVKERILEYLAVQKRVGKIKGAILCLVGPPGVGKTSLGKSIARATGRKFVRMSLGGIRDEAEIRGHRRTYIGSLPGKIIQQMKKAGTKNPLFLLDEIDKVGTDYRGDPSSALLEALDPEQNVSFNDHYLEVDYDLSDVMFVTTANTLSILPPLLDRLEVIRIPGYTEDEKINIANNYLIPKQIKDNGLNDGEWNLDKNVIKDIIQSYTKEAGVRNLEREISKLARKTVKNILISKIDKITINSKNLSDYLGVKKFKYDEIESNNKIGVATGLAWTEFGGEILKIESAMMPGKGKMQITGKLGDVMQESVKAAKSYVRSKSLEFGIIPTIFEKKDFHVHVPEGATPKDGPSAGIAMVASIVSVITGIPIDKNVAMTGEVTLRGYVLPIGGLKEKLLAAHRARIPQVIIPEDNKKDLAEIPKNILDDLKIITVKSVDEVLKTALIKELKPIEWIEVEKLPQSKSNEKPAAGSTH